MSAKRVVLLSLGLSIAEFMVVFIWVWFQNGGSIFAGLVMGLPTLVLSFLVFAGALLAASHLGARYR